ncbi:efflux RND transporter permease subunit [Candidatus Photodesmus anomalopis]|uniref:Cation/multidrug efflux pump n=1 Tax=Candidatus Photodesmus katoptron Akat1 TaxID=1236703 RepID=S3DG39_9GAMM|nr:efflux RND transporter permease subunit [Candidatus Photodesmus katoptron]EPE37372.1 cation/multidrug efflux pump [Candidatus Photodesmus katoptron Akat1]
MWLSDVSIKRPVIAIVLSLLLVLFGIVSFLKLPVREMPDINTLSVTINTHYKGASASIIENQITSIIEKHLSNISGIDEITSSTRRGFSRILIKFRSDSNTNIIINDIRDRLASVRPLLPDKANDPILIKDEGLAEASLYINLSSSIMDRFLLTDYVNRVLIDRFNLISGVSSVHVFGGLQKVMYVKLIPDLMAARGVRTVDVINSLKNENIEHSAGQISNDAITMSVRVARSYNHVKDFNYLIVKYAHNNIPIYLKDVADVYIGNKNENSSFKSDGAVNVSMAIITQSDANPLEVSYLIKDELKKIQKFLPDGTRLDIDYDATLFIKRSIDEVYTTLFITIALVIFVLYIFIGQLGVTFIPALTVPISLISSFIVANYFGFSINLFTLMALILSIGLVVDDAIVVLENIFHHLEQGKSALVAAYRGVKEVSFAVIATTLILVMVFLPISFMDGIVGLFFKEFSVFLAMSVIFSSFVALTLTPVLSSKLLKPGVYSEINTLTSFIMHKFSKLEFYYRNLLKYILKRKWIGPFSIISCICASFLLSIKLPSELLPVEDRGVILAFVRGSDSSSYHRISSSMNLIEDRLMPMLDQDFLKSFSIQSPAFSGLHGDQTGFIIMILKDWDKRILTVHQALDKVRQAFIDIPDVKISSFIPSFSSGLTKPIQFILSGSDYVELQELANILKYQAEISPFMEGVDIDYSEKTPELVITVDKKSVSALGINVSDIFHVLEVMLNGISETTFIERGEEYDVYLRGDDSSFNNVMDLSKIYIPTASGKLVVLNTIANIEEMTSSNRLSHYNRKKSITLTANISNGHTLGQALNFLEKKAIQIIPSDISINYSGESKEYKENRSNILIIFILSLFVAYLVLAAQFESFINPLVIIFTVPIGGFGGLLGLFLTNQGLNIYSQIGMIMLIGMVTKNGILIVEFANQLRDSGLSFEKAILNASERRLRPILMTSFTTIIASMPLILSTGPGHESRISVGTVIFFGMGVSTIITLFIIPAMYNLISASTKSPGYIAMQLNEELKNDN